ncbi:MAG: BrnA antitoxin family protein [Rhodospirillales bacterium]|nr:BrnA antitoxin family protein [Rhodospirillales bacterium]
MTKRLTDRRGDVRPLAKSDFRKMKPAREAMPDVVAHYRRTRGPQKAPTKVSTTIRLDAKVIDFFKAKGPRWQSRINDALKAVVDSAK